ncbi:MAG: acyl-CoA dehydrogenase family protein [Reyranella sp.]|uniref:acyl-CoA dehydrogenase family protein n=1 Tax=Reyranella sp. TaxID=1929291 RepID=UPI001AC51DEF|nr:acyl-CoA dehydrogenase family protein [Reyranella sp.]MBN9089211.1 acyl-CoA dehydrogenase family protein [Reyranella sp.]
MTTFTDEQIAIRDTTRAFVQREVIPYAAEWDREARVPIDTVMKLGALGLFGVCAPVEWGGGGGDFLAYMLMTEELAYGDAGICNMVNATNSFGAKVRDSGTPEQKARFLRPVSSGEALGCLLMTEPHTGSDAAAMRTRAVCHGDTYVLNGAKSFITSGRSAGYAVIFAVSDPAAGKRGLSAFLTRTDKPGYRVVREETKLGHRSNDTCQIALEDLEVPVADLLGRPGDGLRIALAAMDSTRVAAAAQAIGVARAARDAALAYARERQAFGKPILEHQAVAFRLADMATEIEVARQMCHHVARLKSAGVRCVKEASMAKLYASQMSERVCSAAIQVHGGYGYVADFPVEKYYRDARVFQIYDGTNDVQKILISRELAAGR